MPVFNYRQNLNAYEIPYYFLAPALGLYFKI